MFTISATPQGVEYFTERHVAALFSHGGYLAALRAAGLEAHYDEEGLMGRGLYIGIRSDGPAGWFGGRS